MPDSFGQLKTMEAIIKLIIIPKICFTRTPKTIYYL